MTEDLRTKWWRNGQRYVLAIIFLGAGVLHFIAPAPYRGIVPHFLPAPGMLVVVSGMAEIVGGLGLLLPRLRRPTRWWLVALLVAVFPANVQMLLDYHARGAPEWQLVVLWLRLGFQFVLVWWVVAATRGTASSRS